ACVFFDKPSPLPKEILMRSLVKTIMVLSLFALSFCPAAFAQDLPVIRVGYIFTTNHTPFMAAMAQGKDLTVDGYSLSPIIPKEKYELLKDGTPIAMLDILVAKSGSETSTLFAQNHLDMALCSITAILSGIDKGVPMKIVSPVVLASGGLVVLNDSPVNSWADFAAAAKAAKTPLKVGYHSPNSAPIIILEAAMRSEGLVVSSDPNNTEAQVVLVDLKGTTNMLPALASKQVDAVVGPEPFPQTAVFKKTGRIVEELRTMPPSGKWQEYPCCVVTASDAMIAKNPGLVRDFAHFISAANTWCNANLEKAGVLGAGWIGLPEEVGKMQRLRFLSSFTDNWKQGANGYLEVLNKAGYFKGGLKDKDFSQAESLLVDYGFLQ
ncbi:ABC transporter substrate-binding protein, partial [Desulfovibrio sp. OttesenSCG-928-G15]|nr:ABC transporter substrate-binding protein [Desulfovibrio sp. OttesenSCG-928-G15]